LTQIGGRNVLRTVLPSIADQASCVNCHNRLQPAGPAWRLGDVMGALVIDAPADDALARARRDGWAAGGAAAVAIFLLAAFLHAARMHRWHTAVERHAGDRLVDAIGSMSSAISVFD